MTQSQCLRNLAVSIEEDLNGDCFEGCELGKGLVYGYMRNLKVMADLIDTEGLGNPAIQAASDTVQKLWRKES